MYCMQEESPLHNAFESHCHAVGESWTEHMLFIPRGGAEYIAATFTLPRTHSETSPCPLVLMCHGFTGNRIETRRLFVLCSRRMAKAGIGSLRFDYRGNGESSGTFDQYCFDDYVDDARAALQFLTSIDPFSSATIGLLGFSLGGAVAACLLESNAEIFKALCLWAPVANTRSLIKEMYYDTGDLEKIVSRDANPRIIDFNGIPLSTNFIAKLWNVEPIEVVKNVTCPVLICHGTEDDTVHPEHTKKIQKVLASLQKSVEIYWLNESNHTFASIKSTREILKKTITWFSTVLYKANF